jgi:putative adenylate-forming enzyme
LSGVWTLVRVLAERSAQERSSRWTREELERHQARALAELRRFATARSPFYREFHRGLEQRELEALPILSKANLMERFDDVVTDRSLRLADIEAYLAREEQAPYRGRHVVLATSGSTGRRGVFLFDDREWIRALAAIARPILWAQMARKTRRIPRSALIASSAPWHYSARVGAALSTRLAPSLRLDAALPIESLVARLNAWQPQALAVFPSVLRQLAAEQLAGRLRIALVHVATSAEVLTQDVRDAVQQAWGIPVRDTYGATEYAPIAAECEHGRRHLFENGAIIEIVDAAGRAVRPGERGEKLLLTIFDRLTQPLIRYEISDFVRLVDEVCPCGRPYRVIESIEGRQEEVLYFASRAGGEVAAHPNVFHDALERIAVTGWQVVQVGDTLEVRLLEARDAGTCEAAAHSLRGALEAIGAQLPVITVQPVQELQRGATGKAPLIVRQRRSG